MLAVLVQQKKVTSKLKSRLRKKIIKITRRYFNYVCLCRTCKKWLNGTLPFSLSNFPLLTRVVFLIIIFHSSPIFFVRHLHSNFYASCSTTPKNLNSYTAELFSCFFLRKFNGFVCLSIPYHASVRERDNHTVQEKRELL